MFHVLKVLSSVKQFHVYPHWIVTLLLFCREVRQEQYSFPNI